METITKKRNTWLNIFSMIVLSAVVGISSCGKEKVVEPEPDLPPLTTTGRMTFGCYVNGEPWVAKVPPFQPYYKPTGGGLHINNDNLLLMFANKISTGNDDYFEVIQFRFNKNLDIGINYINYSQSAYKNFNRVNCLGEIGDYTHEIDSTYSNNVEIFHFDLEKRIISGKFELRVVSLECRDTVLITDGRFDVKFTIVE